MANTLYHAHSGMTIHKGRRVIDICKLIHNETQYINIKGLSILYQITVKITIHSARGRSIIGTSQKKENKKMGTQSSTRVTQALVTMREQIDEQRYTINLLLDIAEVDRSKMTKMMLRSVGRKFREIDEILGQLSETVRREF